MDDDALDAPGSGARLSPGEFRALFDAAPDGIVVVDERGRILEVNPQVEEMFGWSREELLDRDVEVLVPERVRSAHREERSEYTAAPRKRPMGIGMQLEGRRKDGSRFPVEISLSPVHRDDGPHVIATVRDVSERLRLRRFGTGTLQATEEERRRIARELHDDTAQRLATVLLRLRLAANAESPERQEIMDEIRSEIQEVVDGLHRITRGLRPPALEEAGVVMAIRSHLRRVSEASGVRTELEVGEDRPELDRRLDPDRRLVLYRVIQEAVANTVRHSGADSVSISLQDTGGGVRAVVEDRGTGFDPKEIRARGEGLGLIGMEERVSAVGGRLEIDSEAGRGTRVLTEVPATASGEATGGVARSGGVAGSGITTSIGADDADERESSPE